MSMQAKDVLVVSPGDDVHAVAVRARIQDIYGDSVSCHIFDVATYPLSSSVDVRLEGETSYPTLRIAPPLAQTLGSGTGQLLVNRPRSLVEKMVILGPETAVWWRRYRRPILHPHVTETEFREFCHQALKSVLLGALNFCRVYNPIQVEEEANHKLGQLVLARLCGLHVPRTLISDDGSRIQTFIASLQRIGKRVIYKHVTPVRGFGMGTRIVDEEAGSRFDALKYAPTIFQEEIAGGLDLRIAVVGSRVFCCEWRGALPDRRFVDIRLEEGQRMYPGRLPRALEDPLLDLHTRLGLTFGIYDFKLDSSGRPYFLEVNPSGQWLDMEVEGKQPISTALAHLLVEGRGTEASTHGEPYSAADLKRMKDGFHHEIPSAWKPVLNVGAQ